MKKIEKGARVVIEYEGLLENGETVESSSETGPFELEVGKGAMPPSFENALIGMHEGEEKTIILQPNEAFGHHDKKLLHTVNKSVFGETTSPQPGMVLGMTVEKGGQKQKIPALVTAINGEEVTIDFNHPLAGKTITYKIIVRAVK